jgi:hypothetical protein
MHKLLYVDTKMVTLPRLKWLTDSATMQKLKMFEIQVHTAASMKFIVFYDVAQCSRVEVDRRFRGAYYLHHGNETPPWWWRQYKPLNVCQLQCDYTALHPRRLNFMLEMFVRQLMHECRNVVCESWYKDTNLWCPKQWVEWRRDKWMMNWKGCGRKGSCPNFRYHPRNFLEGLKRRHENYNQDSWSLGQELNPGSTKCQSRCINQSTAAFCLVSSQSQADANYFDHSSAFYLVPNALFLHRLADRGLSAGYVN